MTLDKRLICGLKLKPITHSIFGVDGCKEASRQLMFTIMEDLKEREITKFMLMKSSIYSRITSI